MSAHVRQREVEPHRKPCGPGEAYRPTTVDIVLGNREVALDNSEGKVVMRGPTAQDLSGAPSGDYIDLRGRPLSPGCFYEKQFKRWFGDRKPTVYAHIATDSEHPGKLAVQYWFFYTFNDFTNKHEGDWEMAQGDFDAATPQRARASTSRSELSPNSCAPTRTEVCESWITLGSVTI